MITFETSEKYPTTIVFRFTTEDMRDWLKLTHLLRGEFLGQFKVLAPSNRPGAHERRFVFDNKRLLVDAVEFLQGVIPKVAA